MNHAAHRQLAICDELLDSIRRLRLLAGVPVPEAVGLTDSILDLRNEISRAIRPPAAKPLSPIQFQPPIQP